MSNENKPKASDTIREMANRCGIELGDKDLMVPIETIKKAARATFNTTGYSALMEVLYEELDLIREAPEPDQPAQGGDWLSEVICAWDDRRKQQGCGVVTLQCLDDDIRQSLAEHEARIRADESKKVREELYELDVTVSEYATMHKQLADLRSECDDLKTELNTSNNRREELRADLNQKEFVIGELKASHERVLGEVDSGLETALEYIDEVISNKEEAGLDAELDELYHTEIRKLRARIQQLGGQGE